MWRIRKKIFDFFEGRLTGGGKRTIFDTEADMKKISAAFFKNESGREPVREWLKDLGKPDSETIGNDIRTVEFGWPVGMPVCRPLGEGLYEVRSALTGGRISRVIFCIIADHMYLLHGFVKKTQATPPHELNLAKQRKRQLDG